MMWAEPGSATRTAADKTYVSSAAIASTSNNYTFTGADLGAEDPTRYVLIGITNRSTVNLTTVTANIAGVAAETIVPITTRSTNGANSVLTVMGARVPTGTTGDVVVRYNSAPSSCGVMIWRITGLRQFTNTATDTGNSSASMTSSVPYRGHLVCFALCATSATWTGASEDAEIAAGTLRISTASLANSAGFPSQDVTVGMTPGATSTAQISAQVAFR